VAVTLMTTVRYLVTYDIGDDERREDISLFLTGYGPRVQLSVFEVELSDRDSAAAFRARLSGFIEPDDDQIHIYPLPADSWREKLVYGNRTLEERADFWIV
jgi:CRISPR-associated protein Cas2